MGYLLYNLLLTPLSLPFLLFYSLRKGEDKRERLGRFPVLNGERVFWFHGASVGEVTVISSILQKVGSSLPDSILLLTSMTRTGKRRGVQLKSPMDNRTLHLLLPLDFLFSVRSALRRIKPHALILAESELWPNLLRETKRRGGKIVLVNGRISERSFRAYRLFRFFFRDVLLHIDLLLVQGEEDRDRLLFLGVPPERIQILGSLKPDSILKKSNIKHPQGGYPKSKIRARLGIPEGRRLIVCGSTRPGEEKILLEMFREVKRDFKDTYLILAPRHPSRFKEVEALLEESGFHWRKRSFQSQISHPQSGYPQSQIPDHDILLLDTLGELEWVYGAGEVAFVGGSLLPFGGHNLSEPARWGIPVLFGPFIENTRKMGEELVSEGGGMIVKNVEDLTQKVLHLLSNPEVRGNMGKAALTFLRNHQGTFQKTFQLMLDHGIFLTEHKSAFSIQHSAYRSRQLSISNRKSEIANPHSTLRIPHSLLLIPLSFFYHLGYSLWRLLYKWNFLRQSELNGCVISVGNITVGGTGKTPFVQYLASRMSQNGNKVAILTRGYGRKNRNSMMIVGAGFKPAPTPESITSNEVGDEPHFLSKNLKGVSILIGKNRIERGRLAERQFGSEIFILDDGFQYLKLKRDLNIVLIDAINPFGNGHLLPAGRLREPITSLKRADLIVLTRTDQIDLTNSAFRLPTGQAGIPHSELYTKLLSMNPDAPILESVHKPKEILPVVSGQRSAVRPLPPTWLEGKRVIALSSIGNPLAFERTLERMGARILEKIRFRDHHPYTEIDLERIEKTARESEAEAIVTTEKDEVRLSSVIHKKNLLNPLNPLTNYYVLKVEMEITKGEDILWRMIEDRKSLLENTLHIPSPSKGEGKGKG